MSSDKCVVCGESAKAAFEWFCADCDKSFNDFLDEIGDETFLPNFIQWAANRAREKQQAEIAALRAENAELRAKALVWHKWPDEKPSDGVSGIYFCRNDRDLRWWKKFWRGFYSLGQWDSDDLTHWAEIPRPEKEPA